MTYRRWQWVHVEGHPAAERGSARGGFHNTGDDDAYIGRQRTHRRSPGTAGDADAAYRVSIGISVPAG
jgi:hypothetical protein